MTQLLFDNCVSQSLCKFDSPQGLRASHFYIDYIRKIILRNSIAYNRMHFIGTDARPMIRSEKYIYTIRSVKVNYPMGIIVTVSVTFRKTSVTSYFRDFVLSDGHPWYTIIYNILRRITKEYNSNIMRSNKSYILHCCVKYVTGHDGFNCPSKIEKE
jgi:hypothetical protein